MLLLLTKRDYISCRQLSSRERERDEPPTAGIVVGVVVQTYE